MPTHRRATFPAAVARVTSIDMYINRRNRSLAQNVMKLGHNKRAALTMPEADKPPIKCVGSACLNHSLHDAQLLQLLSLATQCTEISACMQSRRARSSSTAWHLCFTAACRLLPRRKFKEWQMGVAMFVIGNILNFVSFGERQRMQAAAQA